MSADRLRVFAYVDTEKTDLYREVMRAFMRARDGFRLHLRPSEVMQSLKAPPDSIELEAALKQLCDWGNLVAHADTAAVTTVQDFYRPRFLFQLTAEGEAAERAIHWFETTLQRPGELQTAALQDIRAYLEELAELGEAGVLDVAKVSSAFAVLRDRFNSLTDRAQAFMASLQRGIDLHGIELERFLSYKQRLIEYLDGFIMQLVIATSEVTGLVERIEARGVHRLLAAAATRELADRLSPTAEETEQVHADWLRRWEGLRGWFIPRGNQRSQSEVLRATARAAIPQLLSALAGIHDRRLTRTDRAQDFRTLARWFAESPNDAQAHQLFRVAFGLSPSRHLSIDGATLLAREQTPVPPSASWLEAPPLTIVPRLRETGRLARPGRANSVVDRTEAKAKLGRLARETAAQLHAARDRFATGEPFRLSSLGVLRRAEFDLLLDLLGDALGLRDPAHPETELRSADGTLVLQLLEAPKAQCVLTTEDGELRLPDYLLVLRRADPASPLGALG